MKKLLYTMTLCAMILEGVFVFTGCEPGADDDTGNQNNTGPNADIIGTWKWLLRACRRGGRSLISTRFWLLVIILFSTRIFFRQCGCFTKKARPRILSVRSHEGFAYRLAGG
jgi:hypothetical protein